MGRILIIKTRKTTNFFKKIESNSNKSMKKLYFCIGERKLKCESINFYLPNKGGVSCLCIGSIGIY